MARFSRQIAMLYLESLRCAEIRVAPGLVENHLGHALLNELIVGRPTKDDLYMMLKCNYKATTT